MESTLIVRTSSIRFPIRENQRQAGEEILSIEIQRSDINAAKVTILRKYKYVFETKFINGLTTAPTASNIKRGVQCNK